MTTYSFYTQLEKGLEGERSLLPLLRSLCPTIRKATAAEELRGLDFIGIWEGRELSFQVKTDEIAHKTGNAFIEVYSKYPTRPGWAHSCQADLLLYYLPQVPCIYILRPADWVEPLVRWLTQYPHRRVRNEGWTTIGILVPLHELARIGQVAQ